MHSILCCKLIDLLQQSSCDCTLFSFSEEVMEIINLILQALIEFCAGNYENQEVVVNRQISGDITWILSAETKDRQCEVNKMDYFVYRS